MSDLQKVVVVGTGFVGLPLALLLASEGIDVVGVDIDEDLTAAINDGTLHVDDRQFEALLQSEEVQSNLVAQTTPEEGDAFVVSVPTPLTHPEKSPNLAHLRAAVESITPYLSRGDVVNIESTIPPRTCETVVTNTLTDAGFEVGEDVHLAHSPERILPGNVLEELVQNDRVVGGATPECADAATRIYEPFLQGEVYQTDLLSAELCKLMENTFRDINVAVANEFALIGEQLETEITEVIELANEHPRVDILTPGIGVGGHCLPVDPWFLNEVDPEHTNLITTARRINDKMPQFAARRIRRAVAAVDDPAILALGAAYKPNTYDTRNSPAVEIVERLQSEGYSISHYDARVPDMEYDDLQSLVEREQPDVLLQLVPHDQTVSAISELRPWLADRDVEILQFGGEEPLSPEVKITIDK